MKPTIFISYARTDSALLHPLAADLSSKGFHVWYDTVEVLAGQNFVDRVFSAIRASDIVLVLLTERSARSEWVKEETAFAKLEQITRRHITLIPLLFEDCETPPHLSTLNYADFRQGYTQGLAQLLRAVDSVSSGSGESLDPRVRDFLAELGRTKIAAKQSTLGFIDRLYVPPVQFSQIVKILQEKHSVFIVGDPHTGKTYTALYLLWRYYLDGYRPSWITYDVLSFKFKTQNYDIASLCAQYLTDRSIVYIEDPFGAVAPHEIEAFNHGLRELIASAPKLDCRVIITSRDYVIRETIQDAFLEHFVFLSASLKASGAYTPDAIRELTGNYLAFYGPHLDASIRQNDALIEAIRGLEIPHNIEFCIRSLIGVTDIGQAQETISQARDIVAHLYQYFRRSLPEDRLLLIVIGMFSEEAIPVSDKRRVLERCLHESRLLTVEGELGIDRLELLVDRNAEYVTVTNIRKRYWPRFGGYLVGGPPEIGLDSHQLRHPSYWEAVMLAVERDPVFKALAQRCIAAVLDDVEILRTTQPRIASPLESDDEKRALRDIQDNFMLVAAMELLAGRPALLSNDLVSKLILLLNTCAVEHVAFSIVQCCRKLFLQIPRQLQTAALRVATESKVKRTWLLHAEIARIVVDHYEDMSVDQQAVVPHAVEAIARAGSEPAAKVIIGPIRQWLSGSGHLNDFLKREYARVLDWYTAAENNGARGVLADLWAFKTENPYPELEHVYQKIRMDSDGFVRDVFRLGFEEAEIAWM